MLNRFSQSSISASQLEQLEDRKLMSASYDIGINLNDNASASVAKLSPVLKNLGVKTVRLWTSVSNFNNHAMQGSLQRAIDYSNAGFNVTMEIHTDNGVVPNPSAVKGWFQWAMSNSALRNAVDQWEIGNEPDHYEYWRGSLASYVSNFLKPAYEALSPYNEDVISAGPSWNVEDVRTMINAGMLNYTDYVGFHPYASGVSGVTKSVNAINALVAGRKPIAATEWNVRGYEGDKTSWAAAVEDVFPTIKAGFALNYYFAAKTQNSMAGPGGILTSSFTPNQPFYNAFATFKNSGSTTTPSPGTGGNTASGTASISGTLFNDGDADGVRDANEGVTGSRQVFLDTDGDGKLDAGEKSVWSNSAGVYTFTGLSKGTYNVSRVFPSGYKLSNNSKGYVATTVAVGQKVTGVNLGTTDGKSSTGNTGGSTGGSTGNTGGNTDTGSTDSTIPAVTAINLVNTATGAVIQSFSLPLLKKNPVIVLSELPASYAFVAVGTTGTKSMVLSALGKKFTEETAPYAFFGESNGNLTSFSAKRGQNYTLGATAYSGDNATGTKSATSYVTFLFV